MKKMKKLQVVLCIVMMSIMTITLLPTHNVSAMSKKQRKANHAYAKAIKKKKIGKFKAYYMYDVNGDGVKELILCNWKKSKCEGGTKSFYTYRKGKVKKIFKTESYTIAYNKSGKSIILPKHDYPDEAEDFYYKAYKYNGKKIAYKCTYSEVVTKKHKVYDEYGEFVEWAVDEKKYYRIENKQKTEISKSEYDKNTKYDKQIFTKEISRKKLIKKLSK